MSSRTVFQAPPAGQVKAVVTTAQLFPNLQTPAVPVTLNVLGSGRLDQKDWTAAAVGSVTTGTTSNVTATLYMAKTIPGTPFTAANWTVIGASSARSLASVTSAWKITTTIQFESIGGTMQGTFGATILNLTDAAAAISNVLTGLNGTSNTITQPGSVVVVAAEPVFYIAVGLTFSSSNAGNIGTLGNFVLDC